jgi:autotransporter-associated beta strand protein
MNAALGGYNAFDSWNNNISGPGSFTLNGTGTLQFTGANTYTGGTTINGGTLVVTGSIVSPTLVAPGGTLAGTGTIGALTVSGNLAPGLPAIASPTGAATTGTLTSTGAVTFTPGSNYTVKFNAAGQSDNLTTSGKATLAGNVQAIDAPGGFKFYQSYPILDAAGGISGTFQSFNATATGLSNAFLPVLSYGPNEVDLVLDPNTITSQLPGGANAQVRSIARGIDGVLLTGNAPAAFVNLFTVAPAALPATIQSLSGEAVVSTVTSAFRVGDQFLNNMLDPFTTSGRASTAVRLAQNASVAGDTGGVVPAGQTFTVWATAVGGNTTTDGSASLGTSKVTDQTYGVSAGADYYPTPAARVGFALGAGGTGSAVRDGLGSSTGSYGQFGANGLYDLGPIYLAAAADYSYASFNTTRDVDFNGFDRMTANPSGNLYGGRVETGYNVLAFGSDLVPYAAVQAQRFSSGRTAETTVLAPTNFGLVYQPATNTSVQTELGARGMTRFAFSGLDLAAFGRLAWAHEADRNRSINAVFEALPSGEFTIYGARPGANAALASVGAQIDLHNGIKLAVSGDGDFSSKVTGLRGELNVRYDW